MSPTVHLTVHVLIIIAVGLCQDFLSGLCPSILPRSEWGARQSKNPVSNLTSQPVPFVIIHHSKGRRCFNMVDCTRFVRRIQHFQMDAQGWDDIGYSFLIGGNGTVFEGRGWDKIGEHTIGYNNVSLGICFMGIFKTYEPTTDQIDAAIDLIYCGVSLGKIQADHSVLGHRDVSNTSTSPGDKLYQEIQLWPNYG